MTGGWWPRNWDRTLREDALGAFVLFVLINATLFPFVWGDRTLQDSAVIASIYASGSTDKEFPALSISREVDEGAPAWQFEPLLVLSKQLLFDQHRAPIWNPYSGFGTPLAADMQSQPYNPLAWIAMLVPTARGYDVFLMLRVFLAGLFTFLYARQFMSLVPSLCAGAAFMYTGYLWEYLTMPEVSVEILGPAVLLASERVLRKPNARSAALFGLVYAWTVIAGMPESMILAVLFAICYTVVRLFARSVDMVEFRRVALWLGAGSLVAFLVSAVMWLPFLEFLRQSFNQHSLPQYAPGAEVDQFVPGSLLGYILPLSSGPPWNNIFYGFSGHFNCRGFCGTVVAFFALLAVANGIRASVQRQAESFPVLFFAATAFLLVSKRFGAFYVNWIGMLPGLRFVQFPKYGEAVIGCAMALLAAYGVDLLLRKRVLYSEILVAAVALLELVTSTAGDEKSAYLGLTAHGDFYIWSLAGGLVVIAFCATVAAFAKSGAVSLRTAGALCLTAVVLELNLGYIVPMFYVVTRPAPQSLSTTAQDPRYLRFLQQHVGNDRIYGEDALLYPNWSAAFDLRDVRALNALYYERYLPFVNRFFPPRPGTDELTDRFGGIIDMDFSTPLEQRFLQLSSIRYIATSHRIGDSILARILKENSAASGSGFYEGDFEIGGVLKPGLFVHPPREDAGATVEVPSGAERLRYSIGMLPAIWKRSVCGDGVRFTTKVASGGVVRQSTRYIDPKHIVAQRRWIDGSLDVRSFAGKRARVSISTNVGPSGSTCADWAVFGDMRFDPRRPVDAGPFLMSYRDRDASIYHYDAALPRISAYSHVLIASSSTDALAKVGDLDARREAVIESDDAAAANLAAAPRDDVVGGEVDAYTPTLLSGTVRLRRPSLVVVNDTYFPGWTASLDGSDTPIVHANYLFRGVFVPAGIHRIVFSYRPVSFEAGLVLSLFGLALTIVLVVSARSTKPPQQVEVDVGS